MNKYIKYGLITAGVVAVVGGSYALIKSLNKPKSEAKAEDKTETEDAVQSEEEVKPEEEADLSSPSENSDDDHESSVEEEVENINGCPVVRVDTGDVDVVDGVMSWSSEAGVSVEMTVELVEEEVPDDETVAADLSSVDELREVEKWRATHEAFLAATDNLMEQNRVVRFDPRWREADGDTDGILKYRAPRGAYYVYDEVECRRIILYVSGSKTAALYEVSPGKRALACIGKGYSTTCESWTKEDVMLFVTEGLSAVANN